MEADDFEEDAFFAAIAGSGARALLIGRRAMVALGIPVLTADYDLWVHIDDIEKLNAALEHLGLFANRAPDDARARGRYVLENGQHVDVLVARASTTAQGDVVEFEDVWSRRVLLPFGGTVVAVPSVDDLVRTKRWAMREKDVRDIELLEALRRSVS